MLRLFLDRAGYLEKVILLPSGLLGLVKVLGDPNLRAGLEPGLLGKYINKFISGFGVKRVIVGIGDIFKGLMYPKSP